MKTLSLILTVFSVMIITTLIMSCAAKYLKIDNGFILFFIGMCCGHVSIDISKKLTGYKD